MLHAFAGRWSLSRLVEDRREGAATRVEGTVTLAPHGAGLVWDEAGTMRRPDGAVLVVGRRYLWRQRPDGGIAVLFDDGRPFHDFHPGRADAGETVHLCAPDRYAVRYAFELPQRWRAVWRVTGPRKDYVSTTEYLRLG